MNCKPGDLAIVIGAKEALNIGKIVQVIQYIGEFNGGKDCWEVAGDIIGAQTKMRKTRGVLRDSWLRPVSGLPIEEETEQKLKEPA